MTKLKYRLALPAIVAMAAISGVLAAQPAADGEMADATRASLTRFLAETTTLKAEFSQTLFGEDPGRGPLDESRGTLTLKRPGRFRWDYTEPYEKAVVADGEKLWIYEADLDQVIVRNTGDSLAANPAMLLSGDADLDEAYVVRGAYRTGEVAWLELAPRTKDGNFGIVRLGLEDDQLRLMELVDNLDQVTRISFSRIVTNPEIPDSVFAFEPPEGVDVQILDH